MKKLIRLLIVSVLAATLFVFTACNRSESGSSVKSGASIIAGDTSVSKTTSVSAAAAVTDSTVTATESTDEFTVVTTDGAVPEKSGDVYTITAAGTYTLSGRLDGQIVVEAADTDTVVIELSGATIVYSKDSPVKILSADKAEISAKSGTENVIKDTRSAKKTDVETQGEGAVYAKCDLKLKGTGTLVVEGGYNNGVHTTKDLTVQKLSLKVTAYDNAIKGNDSVTVKSGTVVAISTHGDGIKTQNTDANGKGEVRGDVTFTGGSIAVYAAGDGIQAAHNFETSADADGNVPTVVIYTGSYSGYTASGASTTSYKGVKAQNELNVNAGYITLNTYDDGLHCDHGTAFTAGGTGLGTINITGGEIAMTVYSPANKTPGGKVGPGGRGNQISVKGADGIHADYKLNISGGKITIDSSYEGLEANVITVSGGETCVSANDDGVNASKGVETPQIIITGGYLDVAVSPSGDTDGIDSNGTYTQTGGVVIAMGPNQQNMSAIDADGSVKITGGTLIVIGYGRVSTGGSVKTYTLSLHSAGSHTVTIDGKAYTFNNAYSYGQTKCYSSVSVG